MPEPEKPIDPYVQDLIRGKYASPKDEPTEPMSAAEMMMELYKIAQQWEKLTYQQRKSKQHKLLNTWRESLQWHAMNFILTNPKLTLTEALKKLGERDGR